MKKVLRAFTAPKVQRPVFAMLLAMVTYLCLKPGSSVQEEFWLPPAWGLLLDIYDAWKNAFGFGMLGLSAFLGWPQGWGWQGWGWALRWRRLTIGVCGVLLIAMFEGIQYFMPNRHCDLADIIAGGLGITVAGGVSALVLRWVGGKGDARNGSGNASGGQRK